MGNKVSFIRYPFAVQIAYLNSGKRLNKALDRAETEALVASTILELSIKQNIAVLEKALSGHTMTPIDYGKHSIIKVQTTTGNDYLDVSFADARALSAFSKVISREMYIKREQMIKDRRDEKKAAEEIVAAFKAEVALEYKYNLGMPQVPTTVPSVSKT